MSKGTETKSRSDHAWAFWAARALAILLILGAASTMRSSPPTAPEPDLDVDSDNSNWPGGWPDRSQYEDDIEEISNDPQYPGKLIVVNDNDDDGDGIPEAPWGQGLASTSPSGTSTGAATKRDEPS
jgi:hypothetical protein